MSTSGSGRWNAVPPRGQLNGRAVTACAVDVAPQRLVELGQVGPRQATGFRDSVLAHERHVVHASQDAAVRGLGEKNILLLQVAECTRSNHSRFAYQSSGPGIGAG